MCVFLWKVWAVDEIGSWVQANMCRKMEICLGLGICFGYVQYPTGKIYNLCGLIEEYLGQFLWLELPTAFPSSVEKVTNTSRELAPDLMMVN